MDDRIGQQLGNYRLISLLGTGSLTTVYLGEHIYLNTLAAIKVLDALLDRSSIFMFKREAGTLAQLVHPNIVRVLEFGVSEDTVAFLVVTHAPRGTLPRSYPKGLPLSPIVILPYVKQLCSALQYAHDRGVTHRDVRPEHILLGADNEVLLDHFGSYLIKHLSDKSSSLVDSLKESSAADIFAYQAPEQISSHSLGTASDQYSLGIVVYEWLSGERPFRGTGYEILVQHINTPPAALHEKIPTIPPQLEQAVLKAIAKDPQQRFPSIQAFADAFERGCEQASVATLAKVQPISSSLVPMKASTSKRGIKLFFSYSHKDEKLRNELAKRLALLKRNGLITDWYDRNIDAGAEWTREIDTHLNHADIILLLVSPDFIASDYCYNLEMMRALERHEAGETSVIPIILRPVSWKETPFGKLQALPESGKAVTTWSNRDEAFLCIAEGIRKVVGKSNEKNLG